MPALFSMTAPLPPTALPGVNPDGSGAGTGLHYYQALNIQVDTAGNYTFEMASPNTSGSPSNALDTFLRVHDATWDPNTGAGSLAFNDDFTGTLTVLPGPYGAFITATSTGFTGAQPGSRLASVALAANTDYWVVMTSFRNTDYLTPGAPSTVSGATGPFYVGVEGPGNIAIVPEPATFIAIGAGLLGLAIARRRK